MVELPMAIYTKKGDKGKTSIYKKGEKISKSSLRIEAIGAIDELNSALGICLSFSDDKKLKSLLAGVQRDLFVVGSILAGANLRFGKSKTKKLEKVIDKLEGDLPVLKNFILPGGTKAASQLFFTRGIARRTEREVISLHEKEKVNSQITIYLNRLSDFIFMLARNENFEKGAREIVWKGKK